MIYKPLPYRHHKTLNTQSTLNSSRSLQNKIVAVLRNIGTTACNTEATRIESLPTLKRRFHFRNLNLSTANLEDLLDLLDQEKEYKINSISFSHNPIGDEGAILIAERLPNYIEEIGLVDCQISDLGGRAILEMLNDLTKLDMICIEKNSMSNALKLEYQKYGAFNPDLMVMV